jgi:hypothetical protein
MCELNCIDFCKNAGSISCDFCVCLDKFYLDDFAPEIIRALWKMAFDDGLYVGTAEGYNDGYDDGYESGYDEGHENGIECMQDCR